MLGTSTTVGQLLLNRGFGLEDAQAARAFIRPELKSLIEPAALPGCTKAADRIARALREGERIVIYGDYDVDGITATAILWHALVILGGDPAKIVTYVPHRVDEGYGINSEALLKLGGSHGEEFRVRPGDVIIIPAGVGHQCLDASEDFQVVGAYPRGEEPDLLRSGEADLKVARERIAKVPLPEQDPLHGKDGPLLQLWTP